MKYTSFLHIGIVAVALATASCNKFLDHEPLSVPADQTTWKSADDVESAVATCYSKLRRALNQNMTSLCYSYYAYGDLSSDELGTTLTWDMNILRQMQWGNSIAPTELHNPQLATRRFDDFYQAVAQSNRCLYFVPGMSTAVFGGDDMQAKEDQKNAYLSEALFVRSLAYFMLCRIWGDVPLVRSYTVDVAADTGLARSPQQAVLDTCISDLKKALVYLPQDETGAKLGIRASKSAVNALLAHIYAWKGDYTACYTACREVLDNTTAHFADRGSYQDVFKGQSDESIFEIAQNSTDEGSSNTISSVTLMAPYTAAGAPDWQINADRFFVLFDTLNDRRYANGFDYIRTAGNQGFITCTKYANLRRVTGGSTVFYIFMNNIILFRYSDICLLAAEAAAAKTAPDYAAARSQLNRVRAQAGLGDVPETLTGNDLLNFVFDERARELYMEGHRYFDMVRQKRLTGVNKFEFMSDNEFAAGKYYRPIDPSLFFSNRKLKQTPFWQNILTY